MFVVDGDDFEVYAYLLSDRSHDAGRDLTLAGDHGKPKGIWGNDETFWVSSETESRLFAYTRSDGSRNPDLDFYLADAGNTGAGACGRTATPSGSSAATTARSTLTTSGPRSASLSLISLFTEATRKPWGCGVIPASSTW